MDKLNDASQQFVVEALSRNRVSEMSEVASRLRDCLEELDRLQIWQVGAHVSQALSELETEICAAV